MRFKNTAGNMHNKEGPAYFARAVSYICKMFMESTKGKTFCVFYAANGIFP